MKAGKILFLVFLFTLCLFFVPANFFLGREPGNFSLILDFGQEAGEKESPSLQAKTRRAKELFHLISYKQEGKKDSFLLKASAAPPFIQSSNLKEISRAERFSVPLFGEGSFAYNKIGKAIYYYSRQGEELWRKEYPYYPVSDYYGKLILLLTGDSSRVYLLNQNGFLMGEKEIYGAYLSDYAFANRRSLAALIFSSGEAYLIQSEGEILFQHNFSNEREGVFLKSCALSLGGELLAVHFLQWRSGSGNTEKRDMLVVLKKDEGQEAEIVYQTPLPKIYPHLLHMALNSHGLLAAAPQETLFWSLKGKGKWIKKHSCKQECPVYRPVYADEEFFAFGLFRSWALLDKEGQILFQTSVAARMGKIWRFLPAKKSAFFGIHSGPNVEYYHYKSQ